MTWTMPGRQKILPPICFLLLQTSAFAQNESVSPESAEDREIGLVGPFLAYVQQGYKAIDSDPKITYKYPKSVAIDLDPQILGDCMAQSVLHDFPNNFVFAANLNMNCVDYFNNRIDNPASTFSEGIIDYLVANRRSCYFVTEKEPELTKWVLGQPENSINPVSIFKKSLSLNGGHIWEALICVNNVVRTHARFSKPRFSSEDIDKEDAEKFFNKFVDIRGDLSDRGPQFKGDHRGSWYRMWGAMIYKMTNMGPDAQFSSLDVVPPAENCVFEKKPSQSKLKSDAMSYVAFIYDEYIGKIDSEPDRRKFKVDINSSRSMNEFFDHLVHGKSSKFSAAELDSKCEKMEYLRPQN